MNKKIIKQKIGFILKLWKEIAKRKNEKKNRRSKQNKINIFHNEKCMRSVQRRKEDK
jgi:hypothetical protein